MAGALADALSIAVFVCADHPVATFDCSRFQPRSIVPPLSKRAASLWPPAAFTSGSTSRSFAAPRFLSSPMRQKNCFDWLKWSFSGVLAHSDF